MNGHVINNQCKIHLGASYLLTYLLINLCCSGSQWQWSSSCSPVSLQEVVSFRTTSSDWSHAMRWVIS